MERIPEIIHESWHPHIQRLFDDPKMNKIRDEILPNCRYYPDKKDIFRVFSMPLNNIKVVIIGQDPYSRGEAIGLSFAVSRTTKIPPSLNIIKNEIIRSKVERHSYINIDSERWKELSHWVQQGVFLLNSALTVERMNPKSHLGYWQWFTREVIKIISAEVTPVWMLWGSDAKSFEQVIRSAEVFKINGILKGHHPAAETRPENKGKYDFTGCNHFNLCNKLLKENGEPIINW